MMTQNSADGWFQSSHLAGVNCAGEELVQLDQAVGGDVEFKCDAVDGIIGPHLEPQISLQVKPSYSRPYKYIRLKIMQKDGF